MKFVPFVVLLFITFCHGCGHAADLNQVGNIGAATISIDVPSRSTNREDFLIPLTGIPSDAEVFRAELVLKPPAGSRRPIERTAVFVKGDDKALSFLQPFRRGLDLLDAVRAHQKQKRIALKVQNTCNGIDRLEVSYRAEALGRQKLLPSVRGIRVEHRDGQSFVLFEEPKLAEFPSLETGKDVEQFKNALARDFGSYRFRIWRSHMQITASTIHHAELVGECGFLTVWNSSYYQKNTSREVPLRYRIRDNGPPLPWGTGLYVHNPNKSGKSYYAVTILADGVEDLSQLDEENSLASPVVEQVGAGSPVLQWQENVAKWMFRRAPQGNKITRLIYTRWESWPRASLPNTPIDYLVVIPNGQLAGIAGKRATRFASRHEPAPVGLHLHAWNGSLNKGYGWWYNADKGAVLIASNQIPYDWWTGHHEALGTNQTWGDGHVQPFTSNRMMSFLDWAANQWQEAPVPIRSRWPKLDLTRVFVAGNSMGGSGSPMYALRFADRVAWAISWTGVHRPHASPKFAKSYEKSYGPRSSAVTIPDERTSPWDYYDDVAWMRGNISEDTGFIVASNGKNDDNIGWPQAVDFARALQETRRPHVFNWGMKGHGTRTLVKQTLPIDIRINQSLPAFTDCSLDDDIGTASPIEVVPAAGDDRRSRKAVDVFDGDSVGAFNAHLSWRTDNVIDEVDRWELTAILKSSAPVDRCTVDVTPRRTQHFRTTTGRTFRYSVSHDLSNSTNSTGNVAADEFNLVTLPQIVLRSGQNRIVIIGTDD